MFRFKNHSHNQPFYHDKAFTLEWNLSDCKWILIRFYNSQRKAWYRSTERNYRFRRWFFRKPSGSFTNLANIHSPFIEVYVFSSWISFPKKHLIPMQVNRLLIEDIPLQTVLPKAPNSINEPVIHRGTLSLQMPQVFPSIDRCPASIPEMFVSTPAFPQAPVCDWPVLQKITEGIITEKTGELEIIHIMQNLHSYV